MSDQQFRRDLICAALTGLCGHPNSFGGEDDGKYAVKIADAALAAAGEQDSHCLCRADVYQLEQQIEKKDAEIASLKRLLEPLTEEECDEARGLWTPMPIPQSDVERVMQWDSAITTVKNRRA